MMADETARVSAATDPVSVTPAFGPLPPIRPSTWAGPDGRARRTETVAGDHLDALLVRVLRPLARVRLAFRTGCARESAGHRRSRA
jgi:hypothetical protein